MFSSDTWEVVFVVFGGLGGALATGWMAYSGWKRVTGREEARLDKARGDLLEILESEVKAWKAKYEMEHAEYISHRDKTHETTNKTNARMLEIVNENALLRAKTDMTEVTTALSKIMECLTSVTHILQKVEQKLDAKTT